MNGTRATTEEQGRAWPWIRSELETPWRQDADRPGRRELLPAAVLFAVLIAALYGRHVWRGAFLADDWLWLGWFHFLDGGLGSVHDMLSVKGPLLTSVRPGHTAWQSLVYLVGGDNRAAHLVAALTIAAVECFLLYCACRLAGLRILPSGCVAFLVAIFPFVDSTRLWFTGSEEAVATSFFLAGLCAALLGLRATGRGRQIAWQASAAVLYLAAISTYETFMAPLLLCGALYVLLIGRSALWRWLADLGVVLVGLLTAVRYARDKRGGNLDLSYLVDRTRQVSGDAVDAVGSAVPDVLLGPFGVALALLAVAGLVNLIRQGG